MSNIIKELNFFTINWLENKYSLLAIDSILVDKVTDSVVIGVVHNCLNRGKKDTSL